LLQGKFAKTGKKSLQKNIPKLYTEKEFNKHNAIGLPPYVTILPKQTEYPIAFTCRKCRKIIIDF
jgi:hypothetical protein